MKVKSILLSLLVFVAFAGFVSVGVTHADLTFATWQGTWFEVKQSETGKAAAVLPLGGEVVKNNEKTTKTYLKIESWDLDTATYTVTYCRYDGSNWVPNYNFDLPVYGGEPENFLAFFNAAYQDTPAILQTLWVPLEVKGKDVNNNPGVVKSGSFKNLGGIFTETAAAGRGMGSMKFTGKFISSDKVAEIVPDDCREPAPAP